MDIDLDPLLDLRVGVADLLDYLVTKHAFAGRRQTGSAVSRQFATSPIPS